MLLIVHVFVERVRGAFSKLDRPRPLEDLVNKRRIWGAPQEAPSEVDLRSAYSLIGAAACVTALVVTAIACRQGEPMGDPKTPVNSPIPNIDRKEPDPRTEPSSSIFDAG